MATICKGLHMAKSMTKKMLEVKNLKVSYINENESVQIIRGFDLSLKKGEIVGVLGESGSGKTISTSAIVKLFDSADGHIDAGEVRFENIDLAKLKEKQLIEVRGKKISYIFQNPASALHPFKRVGRQLAGTLKAHKLPFSKEKIASVLKEVGLDNVETIYEMYPAQLSGGQNQRIMIAQSIICKPELLIADEPTSSIDASIRKRILDLLLQINTKYQMSIVFITHDFDIAKYLCDRIVVMYGGLSVEEGPMNEILDSPLHPYTMELIKCASSLDNHEETLYSLEGMPPTPYEFEDECPFINRCKFKLDLCAKRIPEVVVMGDRKVRCTNHIIYT